MNASHASSAVVECKALHLQQYVLTVNHAACHVVATTVSVHADQYTTIPHRIVPMSHTHKVHMRLPMARRPVPRRTAPMASAVSLSNTPTTTSSVPSLLTGCRLMGVGSSVPPAVLTNDDLAKLVDTNDEWITTRTGIKERHILAEGESLADHAAAAASRALEMAGVDGSEVDMVLLATSSPDDLFGSACQVALQVGATRAISFDITAACSGFVVSLITAAQYVRTGAYRNVLVVGADALSRCVDWRDRGTCILFGDGCGAVLVQAAPSGDSQGCSLLSFSMNSDGAGSKHLHARYCGQGNKPYSNGQASAPGAYANIAMNGQEVFKFAVRAVPTVIEAALAKGGMTKEDIDWLVLHQANQRIINSAADRLGVPPERVVCNLARYGNTSAASIPLALDEAVREGNIKAGDVVAMAGFGAGLTWASAIVRWGAH